MKRKILSVLFALVLVVSFSLVTAVPVAAQGVTLSVTGDGNDNVDYPGEVDQHFSTVTIDASLGITLSGSVDLIGFEDASLDTVWYEAGLVSEDACKTVQRLHNKGVYMIALYDGTNYKVHVQNVPGTTPAESYFTITNPVFDFELTYHDVTVDSGQVDLRVTDDGVWTEPITYSYAEDDVEAHYGLTHQQAIDLGYAADDDLTNARIVSQLFTGGMLGATDGMTFTATYDNLEVAGTPYTLAVPGVLNVDTGQRYVYIQPAIDGASATNTINVAAGTYAEYLHITTDHLTIEGAGIDQSIIDLEGLIPYWHYPGSGSFASRAGVLITGYGSPGEPAEVVEGVTFRGFTVKNAGLNPPITATGTHTGEDDVAILTDSSASWETNALVGQWIHNYGDKDPADWKPARSYGQITANDATTVTATLSGGHENDWDIGDQYLITTYEEFHNTVWIHYPNYDGLRGIAIANGKDVSILYCKVTHCGIGGISSGYARLVSTHKYSEGITVDHCIVTDHLTSGISIGQHVGALTVTNNLVERNRRPNYEDATRENAGRGIEVSGSKYGYGSASGLIADNIVNDNGFEGIILSKYTDGVVVEDNTVTGHNLDQDGAGIFFYGDESDPENCQNHIIRNNVVTGNIRGIVAYYAQNCTVGGDTAADGNTITTDSGGFYSGQAAIKIDGGNNITVSNNTISCDGVGIKVQKTWDDVDCYDNTLTGNTITGAEFAGIFISHGAHDNTFTYNTITGTTTLTRWAGELYEETQGDGVFLWGYTGKEAGTGNVFHFNSIYENADDGIENQTVTSVDAEQNWWGDASGPGGEGPGTGKGVSANVSYNPWHNTSGLTTKTYYVGSGEDYTTIQSAIDSATDGDTVNVAAGTYTEALTITDKGLTITGESEAGVIVQAATSQTGDHNVFAINATDKSITIQNMTIRNGAYGIRSTAGNVNVLHCTIYHNGWDGTGLPGTPTKGLMATFYTDHATDGGAVRIENSAASEVAYCTVYENDRGIRYQYGSNGNFHHNSSYNNIQSGIYLTDHGAPGGCTNTQVHDNTVYGNMNNGILVLRGNNNSITDNNVYNNWNTGIHMHGPSDFTVEGNSVMNNSLYAFNGEGNPGNSDGGIAAAGAESIAATAFTLKILDNTVSNNNAGSHTNSTGIWLGTGLPGAGITINNNTFSSHDIDIDINSQAATLSVNYNDFDGMGTGVRNNDTRANVDALYNWWGKIGGPGGEGLGNGDNVTANVSYDPWLTEDYDTVITDGIAYFGSTIPLEPGWNTLSVPLKLKDSANTIAEIMDLGDFLTNENVQIAYQYKSGSDWENIGESATKLVPLRGYYIKILGTDTVDFPVLYSGTLGLPTLKLSTDWNLIGSGFGIDKTDYGIAATDDVEDGQKDVATALYSIKDKCSVVVSPSTQGQVAAWGTTVIDSDKDMIVGEAYWVFMTTPVPTLAGFEVTPIYHLP